jgi:hypothetical protein
MGRYAHVFATLARRHRHESPTALLEYSSDNALRLVERFAGFRAVDRELTGNYHADRAGLEELFEGRLVRVTDYRPLWEEPAP